MAATACAPPTRKKRSTPASSAAAKTAASGRGQATSTSLTPAARAGMAFISSEEGKGIASGRDVAADPREGHDALLHDHAGCHRETPTFRHLRGGDAADVAGGVADRPPRGRGHRPGLPLPFGDEALRSDRRARRTAAHSRAARGHRPGAPCRRSRPRAPRSRGLEPAPPTAARRWLCGSRKRRSESSACPKNRNTKITKATKITKTSRSRRRSPHGRSDLAQFVFFVPSS